MIEDNGDHLNPASAAFHPEYPDGAELIADERLRQREKGFTATGDDHQTGHELAHCARMILTDLAAEFPCNNDSFWPMQRAGHVRIKYDKDHIRRLVIAGALIAAEIDRLQRAEVKNQPTDTP